MHEKQAKPISLKKNSLNIMAFNAYVITKNVLLCSDSNFGENTFDWGEKKSKHSYYLSEHSD